jgi:uncharacterized protein YkwD
VLRSIDVRAAWILVAATIVACGSTGGGQPSWRKGKSAESKAAFQAITIEMAPRDAAARAYNDPPLTPAPAFELGDALVAEVQRVSAQLGKPPPLADGRLFAAARELAEVAPRDAPLVYTLIEFALQRNGIIEPSPHLIVIWGPTDDRDEIVSSLAQRLPTILGGADFTRVGVGVASRGDDEEVTILALQSSFLETRPIPRRLDRGGHARIDATVKRSFIEPEVFVTRENGDVEHLALSRTAGGFSADMSCGTSQGRQQVEITASDQTGSTVLANFPVWCGEDPPTSISVHLDADEVAPVSSGEEAAQRLGRLINRDRQRHNLPALELDDNLARVAAAHSEEMRQTGVVAHISPRTGSAADRVRAGGIKTSVVLENVARAYGVGEAQEGLMNSPGHRANILSRDATHMGISVVLGEDVAGRRELFVTQLFIRRTARIDRAAVQSDVRAAIARARPIGEDDQLSAVAQELANGVAGGQTTAEAARVANQKLGGMRLNYTKITTLVTTVADLAAFKPSESLGDKSIHSYGVGVAQGDHEVMGEGAIHIVLLLGHR